MNYSVFDIETDALLDRATKIHCVCIKKYHNGLVGEFTLTTSEEIINFFTSEEVIVGHNIYRFDAPVLKKLLGIEIKCRMIDTLALSWYLYPERESHNLANWGTDLGIEKPPIDDWVGKELHHYINRCKEDVKINSELFDLCIAYLNQLYNHVTEDVTRLINYLMFKMQCAVEQEEQKWKVDVEAVNRNIAFLKKEYETKYEAISEIMPPVIKYKQVPRPEKFYTQKGDFTAKATYWYQLLAERNLPDYHLGTLEVEISRCKGNPRSHQQMKAWLFSLGWKPDLYNFVKDEDGSTRKIPQINTPEGELTESVQNLIEDNPVLEHLEKFYVIGHRVGILEGFLRDKDENDFIKAEIQGFTNTLRFQHAVIVNLPQIPKAYWKEIRECLVAPDDNSLLCGSDMTGLEDSTKRHYMFFYDPDYVNEMMGEDFDPHLDIAVLSGMLTVEQANEHKLYDRTKGREGVSHKAKRLKAKKTNFSAIYGAGAPKISLTASIPLHEARLLHTIYWKRNWSVKKIAEDQIVKRIGDQMWLFNPVSQFWYSLRFTKDAFSTLNQGTGVYCFDSWVRFVRMKGIKLCGQFHDEIIFTLPKGQEDCYTAKLREAEAEVNQQLQLNVPLRISIDYGKNYAEVH